MPSRWVMPEWMEPYRELIGDTGGNTVEDLVNDRKTTSFSNAIRAAMITSVQAQVALMHRLHKRGQLGGVPKVDGAMVQRFNGADFSGLGNADWDDSHVRAGLKAALTVK